MGIELNPGAGLPTVRSRFIKNNQIKKIPKNLAVMPVGALRPLIVKWLVTAAIGLGILEFVKVAEPAMPVSLTADEVERWLRERMGRKPMIGPREPKTGRGHPFGEAPGKRLSKEKQVAERLDRMPWLNEAPKRRFSPPRRKEGDDDEGETFQSWFERRWRNAPSKQFESLVAISRRHRRRKGRQNG